MTLQEKIRLIRNACGLSQAKFSKKFDIPMKNIANYESGARKVSAEYLLKISEIFPEFSLWLMTDKTAPEVGQISPDQEKPDLMSMGVPKKLVDESFDKTIETAVALGWLTPKEDIKMSMLADLHRHNFVEFGGILLESKSEQEQSKAG